MAAFTHFDLQLINPAFDSPLVDVLTELEHLRRLHGVKIAAMLREDSPQLCKFSLRSYGDLDVRSIAADLDGGGHFNAAGGTLRMPLEQAGQVLLNHIGRYLDDLKNSAR